MESVKTVLLVAFLVLSAGCRNAGDGLPSNNIVRSPDSPLAVLANEANRRTFVLWQLPSQGRAQAMSYVILTVHDSVIVIDGGWSRTDTAYLRNFISQLGNSVEAWMVTHPHPDHVGALTDILKSPEGIRIRSIYSSLNPLDWVAASETTYLPTIRDFMSALSASASKNIDVTLGQVIDVDGVSMKILGIKNPEITGNAVNNSCMVFRASDSTKSVLFLGDLGAEGGDKILNGPHARELPSDYVQMAHHGQRGVSQNFYQKVAPKFALWPTPAYLWNNDSGGGIGSGTWETLSVRAWMDALRVTNYVSYRGLNKIE